MSAFTRVSGLMARADHPDTPKAEADACRAKAEQIMIAEGITRAAADAASGGKAPANDPPWLIRLKLHGEMVLAQDALIQAIIVNLNCKGCVGPDGDFHVVGAQSDVERSEILAAGMLLHAWNEMERGGVNGKRNREAFFYGFANRIRERMAEQYSRAKADAAQGTRDALVRREDSAAAMWKQYTKEQGWSMRTRNVSSGSESGRRAANSADIGQARMGGRGGTRQLGA